MKEKVIIYALGDIWKYNERNLNEMYDIIACSDQNLKANKFASDYPFILPDRISKYNYDKIILGCKRQGVREILALNYKIPGNKIFYYDEILKHCREKEIDLKKDNEQLTIVIPTYNRKERLKRTLDILEMQTNRNFEIIILDNCSNYAIQDIYKEKSKDFQKKITVVQNKKNIGMAANLGNAFLQKTEDWVWMLSDDDIPSIYAVEDIYKEIENSNQVGVIHFIIYDWSKYVLSSYKDFKSLHELLDFYRHLVCKGQNEAECAGDFIYFSNKVYKMEYIQNYYEKIFTYTYSGIPQLIPILFMLNDNVAKVRLSNKKIVAYEEPDGDHWDWIKTMSGMRTISDFPLELDKEDRKTLYRLIMYNEIDNLIGSIHEESFDYDLQQIDKIYNEIYHYSLNEEEKRNCKYKIEKAKMEGTLIYIKK